MDMNTMDSGGSSSTPLNTSGVDFSNATQAGDFLDDLLDDTVLQVIGNQYARYFWYAIVVFIGIATICRLLSIAILRARIRASTQKQGAAPPGNVFISSFSTLTALGREISNYQLTPVKSSFWIQIPPFGTILVILAYFSLILAMEFVNNHIQGAQYYEGLGVRAGWLAIAQVPLLILLAGKNSLIGLLVGASYDKLNVYHRWVARGLLLMATFHFGFQAYGWTKYPGIFMLEWTTDICIPTGLAAYVILLWLNLSTLAPFRRMSYEIFVLQHLLTFFGFIIAIMIHLPTTALYSRVYIYIPIVLYFLDRLIRTARYAYNNIRPARAKLEALDDQATRIRVSSRQIKKWRPGSHVLLAIPKFGMVQSHPATILSTPSSHNGDLVFILKSHKGFTRRILSSCACNPSKPTKSESLTISPTYVALIDGPYTHPHSDFAAFDTLILVAGGTGITFTLAALLDLAHRASNSQTPLPLRTIDFVWIIKRKAWINWVSDELQSALEQLQRVGINVQLRVHITCDDTFVETSTPLWIKNTGRSSGNTGCQCAKESGQCCCCGPSSSCDDDDDEIRSATTTSNKTATAAADDDDEKKPTIAITSSRSSTASTSKPTSPRTPATVHKGRPVLDAHTYLWPLLDAAAGETAVAVCGPLGLSTQVRNAVVKVSDERACCKGSGAHGVYLWVEQFGM